MSASAPTRVLVTRPAAQAQVWCATLAEHGFSSVAVPMLELVPVSSAEQVEALKARVLDFDRYQKVVFVSRNAVAHADRKSTRLNSSHVAISYAVFCLKKKKKDETHEGKKTGCEGMSTACG